MLLLHVQVLHRSIVFPIIFASWNDAGQGVICGGIKTCDNIRFSVWGMDLISFSTLLTGDGIASVTGYTYFDMNDNYTPFADWNVDFDHTLACVNCQLNLDIWDSWNVTARFYVSNFFSLYNATIWCNELHTNY